MSKNISCRIFKEQLDLVNQLPIKERAEVLYRAISNAFNQIENQNENQFDNQNENQNENAYISVSVSVSISQLGQTILNLLCKNIICKEYSSNYGGKRAGAGKPPKATEDKQSNPKINEVDQSRPKSAADIIKQAADALSVNKANDSILIDSTFSLFNYPVFKPYIESVTPEIIESVENWLRIAKGGQKVTIGFITRQFTNFANRQNKPIFKEQTGRKE